MVYEDYVGATHCGKARPTVGVLCKDTLRERRVGRNICRREWCHVQEREINHVIRAIIGKGTYVFCLQTNKVKRPIMLEAARPPEEGKEDPLTRELNSQPAAGPTPSTLSLTTCCWPSPLNPEPHSLANLFDRELGLKGKLVQGNVEEPQAVLRCTGIIIRF